MKKTVLATALFAAVYLSAGGMAHAQVAGSTTVGITVTEATQVAMGWSVKKGILGKTVYNDAGVRVGKVMDLIISPDRNVSYVIVGAGGFIGIGRHDVAIPIKQIQNHRGKLVMAGATKDTIQSMPAFNYTTDSTRHDTTSLWPMLSATSSGPAPSSSSCSNKPRRPRSMPRWRSTTTSNSCKWT
jgi:sporulation protein YlmC with PRC-barrel domain